MADCMYYNGRAWKACDDSESKLWKPCEAHLNYGIVKPSGKYYLDRRGKNHPNLILIYSNWQLMCGGGSDGKAAFNYVLTFLKTLCNVIDNM